MSKTTEKLEDDIVAEIVSKKTGSVCTDSTDALGMARRLANLSPKEAILSFWEQIEMGEGFLELRKILKNLRSIDVKKEKAIRKELAEIRNKINIILLNQDF
ncbi:hypothetical protein KKA24_03000 [Patescibacteria group bacterium]|nr:hypothetical protein [Patescibacteria group bacterium]